MMPEHDSETEALRREFGYVPQLSDGESWVVYRDQMLIVIHPDRRPRLYPRGGRGVYSEIEPVVM